MKHSHSKIQLPASVEHDDGAESTPLTYSVRIQVLGPTRIWRDEVELDPGPRQQVLLFAVLVAHTGSPVSMGELIDLVWSGTINPGRVFDLTLPLDRVAEGYRAMDERRAIKALLWP